MITAIRIEHPYDGCGIYNSKKIPNSCINDWYKVMRKKHTNLLKNPYEDRRLRGIESDEYCAFLLLGQIFNLFTLLEIETLVNEFGFVIYKLELNDCRIGEEQILYTIENVVTKIDITKEVISKFK